MTFPAALTHRAPFAPRAPLLAGPRPPGIWRGPGQRAGPSLRDRTALPLRAAESLSVRLPGAVHLFLAHNRAIESAAVERSQHCGASHCFPSVGCAGARVLLPGAPQPFAFCSLNPHLPLPSAGQKRVPHHHRHHLQEVPVGQTGMGDTRRDAGGWDAAPGNQPQCWHPAAFFLFLFFCQQVERYWQQQSHQRFSCR